MSDLVARLNDLLPLASEAVSRASRMMMLKQPGVVTRKGDRDPATEVDYAIERQIRDFMESKDSSIGFLGEENGLSGVDSSELTWVLDPIDGTVNFVHGLPLCAISLALVRGNQPVLGAVELPFLGKSYRAVLGGGSSCNGTKIVVSSASRLSDAMVSMGDYAVGDGSNERNVERFEITQRLAKCAERVRMLGSAAIDLAWTAQGLLSASVMLANKPWDTAAGVVIAKEAGALVLDRLGNPHSLDSDSTVVACPGIADELIALIN